MGKSEDLDQYFTKRSLAKKLYDITEPLLRDYGVSFDCWLEPAAGDGAFFELLPPDQRMGIDIHKQIEDPNVIEDDFLTIPLDAFQGLRYVAVGNPPFGQNAALAVKFFNRCADMCEAVAFIVPRTFKKYSVINRLHRCFHLVHQQDLPDNSFEIDGEDKSVPCCFQMWIRRGIDRSKITVYRSHADLEFLPTTRLDEATILFQRVGGAAGTFKQPGTGLGYSWKSNYHIKCSDTVARILRSITFWPTKYHTAGNPSISKSDLIEAYMDALKIQSPD